jgi:hypothetical protein
MISRQLLHISRRSGSATRLPLSRLVSEAQRPTYRLPLLASQRASPSLTRWYSDAAPAAQDAKAQAAPAEGAKEPAESAEAQALRKELEAKNKEIASVKVRLHGPGPTGLQR